MNNYPPLPKPFMNLSQSLTPVLYDAWVHQMHEVQKQMAHECWKIFAACTKHGTPTTGLYVIEERFGPFE